MDRTLRLRTKAPWIARCGFAQKHHGSHVAASHKSTMDRTLRLRRRDVRQGFALPSAY